MNLFPALFDGFCCPTNGYILLVMSNLVYWKLLFDKFARPLPGTMHVTQTKQFSLQFTPHPPTESLVKHLYLRDRTSETLSECEFYKSVKPRSHFDAVHVKPRLFTCRTTQIILLLPRVPKIKIRDKSQISFCKLLIININSTTWKYCWRGFIWMVTQ